MRDRSPQAVRRSPTSTTQSDEGKGCLDRTIESCCCCPQRFRLPSLCRLVWLRPLARQGVRRPVIRARSRAAPELTLPVASTSRRPAVLDEALAARQGPPAQPDRAGLRVHRACKASRATSAPPGRRGRRGRQGPLARLELPARLDLRVHRACKASRATPAPPGRRGLRAHREPPAPPVHREPPELQVLRGRLAQRDQPDRRAQPARAGCLSTRTSSTPGLRRCRSRPTCPWIRMDS